MTQTKLTKDEFAFLEILARYDAPVTRSQLCQITRQRFASKADTKARSACRARGYAEFRGGYFGKDYSPMGWRITPAGRAALARAERHMASKAA